MVSQAHFVVSIGEVVEEFELFDDGQHDDGAMEPDGIYGSVVRGLSRWEGTRLGQPTHDRNASMCSCLLLTRRR